MQEGQRQALGEGPGLRCRRTEGHGQTDKVRNEGCERGGSKVNTDAWQLQTTS